jgi:hypothetical protein
METAVKEFSEYMTDTLHTGFLAGLTTTVAAATCGAMEGQTPVAPLNAVSHILYGDRAALEEGASAQFTLPGMALNAAAVGSWAAVYEAAFGETADKDPFFGLVGGVAVSALAYITDYYVVPRRLTPGFELRLSNKSLFGIYASLALSLGLGPIVCRHRRLAG